MGLELQLMDNEALERSDVVANSQMNRGRGCLGGNSYSKELRLNPLDLLRTRLEQGAPASWLDLCCGSGKALVEAADYFRNHDLGNQIRLVGVDLVPYFISHDPRRVELIAESAVAFAPRPSDRGFDLIRCVHGLHYAGDKLALVSRATTWLSAHGLFIANLDLGGIRIEDRDGRHRSALQYVRKLGAKYDSRRRLVVVWGHRKTEQCWVYRCAERAGPNYTGQPAVNSYYLADPL